MQMQFRKVGKIVAAGTLAGIMLGSSLGFATLDAYPAPFVTSAGVQSLLVVGSQGTDPVGLASDIAGAIDVAARLGGEVSTEVALPGSAIVGTVVGEGAAVQTSNEKIYLGDHLKKTGLRTSLSDTDMPTVLKSSTVTDSDAGTTYDYDQFIDFDNDYTLTFNKISGDLPDPTYLFGEFTTSPSATTYVYRSRAVFTDEVNGTTVVGEKIELFGNKYTFSSGTNIATPKVELFGGADTRTMAEGETVTTTIDGVAYDVKMLVVSDADTVGIQVGSDSKSIDKGKSATVGGLEVFIDDVFYSSKEGTVSSASVLLGARRLILEDGAQVKTKTGGESEKTLDGTFVDLSTSSGKLTGIDVYIAGKSSKDDFLKLGATYVDPVWTTFKLSFDSITNPVKSSTRDYVEITPSGTQNIDLRFTNDRSDRGTIKWAHTDGSTDTTPQLADDNNDSIIVLENSAVDRNQYFVVDSGDFSRIFELTAASSLGSSDGKVDIRDVMAGKTIEVKLGSANATSKVVDGQTYNFNASTNAGTTDVNLKVTWGDSSTLAGSDGDFTTVWPTLKSQRGARVVLTKPTDVTTTASYNQRINLPTGSIRVRTDAVNDFLNISAVTTEKSETSALASLSPAALGTTGIANNSATGSFLLGRTTSAGAYYNVTYTEPTLTIRLATSIGAAVTSPAVLLVEEQDDGSNVYSLYVEGTTELRGSNYEASPAAPVFSYSSVKSATPDTDSDLTKYVDLWGTYAESKVTDQNKVWIWYPDDQTSANIYLLDRDATVSSGGGEAGGTIRSAVPIKTSIAKLDREVTSGDKSNKNLILVGGPAVNSLVAELASGAKTLTLAQWRDGTRTGTAILDLVDDAFASGKSALVVAGYEAADTRNAAAILQNFEAYSSELSGKNRVVVRGSTVSSFVS